MPKSKATKQRCNESRFEDLCDRARSGCTEALGELLDGCRRYLLLVANRQLESDLQVKAGPSDIVQETLLEAHRDFQRFDGNDEEQLLAWLRQILQHNLANFQRRFRNTERRQIRREVPLELLNVPSAVIAVDSDSPSAQAVQCEEVEILNQALGRLPETYRQVIILRHRENTSFANIGQAMNRSADAARMLWWRAFERLSKEINSSS